MTRWIAAWTLWSLARAAWGQPDTTKEDRTVTALAELARGDDLQIYRAYEHLSEAGKHDATIPPRLAALVWNRSLGETSRYWALKTLASIGPNAKSVMPDLLRAMEDADPYFRAQGSLAVLNAGGPHEKPLEALKSLARSKDPLVRSMSLEALGGAREAAKEVLPFLTQVIGEGNTSDRPAAIRAIGSLGPAAEEAIPLLVRLLEGSDEDVRQAAVQALAALAPDIPTAFEPLLKLLGRKGYEGKLVADALLPGGKRIVPALIKVIQGDDLVAQRNAVHALRFMGRTAAPAAADLAKLVAETREDDVRSKAICALGNIGPVAVPHLIALLEDPRVGSKKLVAKAIAEIGPDARGAVPALVVLLKDPDLDSLDRSSAASALEAIGPSAVAALPDLLALLRDDKFPDRDRVLVIRVLGAMGPAAKDAVDRLIQLIKADYKNGRFGGIAGWAAEALGRIGPAAEGSIPLLIEMLSSPSHRLPTEALGRFRSAAKEALPRLREILAKAESEERIYVALAITRIDPEAKDGIEVLLGWLTSSYSGYARFEQEGAVNALAEIGPPAKAALEPLRKFLDHASELSPLAALAIYRIKPGDPAALDSLVRTLASREGAGRACIALGKIGPAAKAALPELRRVALHHSGYFERDEARRAIRAIDSSQEP